jgi:hypothetical protein
MEDLEMEATRDGGPGDGGTWRRRHLSEAQEGRHHTYPDWEEAVWGCHSCWVVLRPGLLTDFQDP